MEGPSLLIASEQLIACKGKKIEVVSGNTKIGKERLLGKEVMDVFSWGKHLVFQFDTFSLRTHFLLFGTYEATINGEVLTGDYQRSREPRLHMQLPAIDVKLFNCSIKVFETSDLKSTYDFSVSIMAKEFDEQKAVERMQQFPHEEIADVLLDQEIFAGVGNMIKNEVLSLVHTNPHQHVSQLSLSELQCIVSQTKQYSWQFYAWKKEFVLRKNLRVHRKSTCPLCGEKLLREKTGKRMRWSYYCPVCQQ